jgi:hypothetical protein
VRSTLAACCGVRGRDGREAVLPGRLAAVSPGQPDGAADPSTGTAGTTAGDNDSIVEIVASASHVGCSAPSRAGLSRLSVIAVDGLAAGTTAVPAAVPRNPPRGRASLAAHPDDQPFAG